MRIRHIESGGWDRQRARAVLPLLAILGLFITGCQPNTVTIVGNFELTENHPNVPGTGYLDHVLGEPIAFAITCEYPSYASYDENESSFGVFRETFYSTRVMRVTFDGDPEDVLDDVIAKILSKGTATIYLDDEVGAEWASIRIRMRLGGTRYSMRLRGPVQAVTYNDEGFPVLDFIVINDGYASLGRLIGGSWETLTLGDLPVAFILPNP